MHNAPSVVYPVGRCRFYAVLLTVLALLSFFVLAAWWWLGLANHLGAPAVPPSTMFWGWGVLGTVLWLLWLAFASYSWRHSPTGQLHWDAQALLEDVTGERGEWRWRSAAYRDGTVLRQVSCMLDFQTLALLRLRNTDGAHSWIWVEQTRDPNRWLDLRRAWVATQA